MRMMLSTEYRECIERRFHAFCKAVLHNETCDFYREIILMRYYLQLKDKQIAALLEKPRTEMEKLYDEE